MKVDFFVLKEQLRTFVFRCPIEIAICLIFFIVGELNVALSWTMEYSLFYMPLCVSLAFVCNNIYVARNRWIYYLTVISPAPVFEFISKEVLMTPEYMFGVVLAVLLLLLCKKPKTKEEFANTVMTYIVDIAVAGLVCCVLMIALGALSSSVFYLFNIKAAVFSYLWQIPVLLVMPLLFVYQQTAQNKEWKKGIFVLFRSVINYVICPSIILYTFFLYMYGAKILIEWELPVGGLAAMILSFYLVAIFGKVMQEKAPNKIYQWYFDNFSYISLPLLVLFWVGVIHRVVEYSLTMQRVYLLAGGVFITISTFMFMRKKYENYSLVTLMAAVIVVMLTYVPYISAKSIGIRCQRAIFERFAEQLKAINPKTGKLYYDNEYCKDDDKKWQTYEKMIGSYDYLVKETSIEEMREEYGNRPSDVRLSKEEVKHQKEEIEKLHKDDFEGIIYSRKNGLDLKRYRYFCCSLSREDVVIDGRTGYVFVYIKGKCVLKEPGLKKEYEKMVKRGEDLPNEAFIVKNDSVMVVFDRIQCRENELHFLNLEYHVFTTKKDLAE